jgi:hypothetical protein
MSYNNKRVTISKKDSICDHCGDIIYKGAKIFIIPHKYISHYECYLKSLKDEK